VRAGGLTETAARDLGDLGRGAERVGSAGAGAAEASHIEELAAVRHDGTAVRAAVDRLREPISAAEHAAHHVAHHHRHEDAASRRRLLSLAIAGAELGLALFLAGE